MAVVYDLESLSASVHAAYVYPHWTEEKIVITLIRSALET